MEGPKGYRKPSHRLLALRLDKPLERALVAAASRAERTLGAEARLALRAYYGVAKESQEETSAAK